jgi:hypothetical protein
VAKANGDPLVGIAHGAVTACASWRRTSECCGVNRPGWPQAIAFIDSDGDVVREPIALGGRCSECSTGGWL